MKNVHYLTVTMFLFICFLVIGCTEDSNHLTSQSSSLDELIQAEGELLVLYGGQESLKEFVDSFSTIEQETLQRNLTEEEKNILIDGFQKSQLLLNSMTNQINSTSITTLNGIWGYAAQWYNYVWDSIDRDVDLRLEYKWTARRRGRAPRYYIVVSNKCIYYMMLTRNRGRHGYGWAEGSYSRVTITVGRSIYIRQNYNEWYLKQAIRVWDVS